ncbi:MAG: DegT/DnrJ/EryC1/StrS family aminotransferase [Chloroflexi bacterium]|nr:DegT/DnrJ/EryC1/StrS family aminotransferase [Chloroflexota bacterium]
MSSPDITDAEREAVAEVLQSPNLSMGSRIQKFEAVFQDYVGIKHAIGVSSGTAGLHLCVRAAGIDQGDLVITTPFSFVASSNVILFERAIPIFVDIDPISGNIDPQLVAKVVKDLFKGGAAQDRWYPRRGAEDGKQLKAILPVDVFGQPADMDPICKIAEEYGLKVIEDSCEALGAEYKGRKAGTLGDLGVFAFYPNKQMTTGEGAVIITDDDQAADMMRALRNQGRSPGDTWLQHTHLGYNYRLDEMSAALGEVQASRLDSMIDKRTKVASWYSEKLARIPGIEVPSVATHTTRMSWFVYVIRFSKELDRDDIAQKLGKLGVPARPYFIPIHQQPYMVTRFGYQAGDFPITEDLGKRSLAIPFSSVMTEEQVDYVCQSIGDVIENL